MTDIREIDALASIASAIGEGYTPQIETNWQGIAGPVRLCLRQDRGRITAAVSWPVASTQGRPMYRGRDVVDYSDRDSVPADLVSVSDTKTPGQIGREIARRLIEPNAELYQRACKRAREEEQYEAGTRALAAALAAENGQTVYRHHPDRFHAEGADVTVNGPDSVSIKVNSVPAEIAREILHAIRRCKGRA